MSWRCVLVRRCTVLGAARLRSVFVRRVVPIIVVLVSLLTSRPCFAALSFSGDVLLNTGSTGGPATIGRESVGSLRLDNGSIFSSGPTQFGANQNGIGFGTVAGPRTTWTMLTADVGFNGVGTLNIEDGGLVDVTSMLRIGTNSTGNGTVYVDGAGSTLVARSGLTVGGINGGVGSLHISDGAIVNASQGTSMIGLQGRVVLDGGLLRTTNNLTNNGLISGSGEWNILSGPTASFPGRMEVGDGDVLRVTGAVQGLFENRGQINVDGGELELLRNVNNINLGSSVGEITLRNGTMRITTLPANPSQLKNSGLLAAIGGENHFFGTVMSTGDGRSFGGKIAVTNHSVLVFHDDVTLQGGVMTVFPGSKATLLEDLAMSSGALLLADIAGSDIDTDYGEIEVVGNVQLGGQLQVLLSNGFVPQAGDSFQILKAYGGIEGSVTLGAMPALPGALVWDVDVTSNQLLLNVVPAPSGDYNRDGLVDAADYVVWRRAVGQSGSGLAADGNGDGVVDQADHAVWRSNFGRTAGGGAGATVAAVPEPTRVVLLLSCMIAAIFNRSRQQNKSLL